jgi:tetratricopeptide (TPR) repeat protein
MKRHTWEIGGKLEGRGGQLVVNCHRRFRGPYAGAGSVLRLLMPQISDRRPELTGAHAIELMSITPDLRDLIDAPPQTLTELATKDERTRLYARTNTARLAHGVIDLLLAWSASAGRLALGFADADLADPTDQEFLSILLRRAPADQITITVTTRSSQPDGDLGTALARHADQITADPATPRDDHRTADQLTRAFIWSDGTSPDPAEHAAWHQHDPAQRQHLHDQRATELEQSADWSLRLGAIPYHREHGTDTGEAASRSLLEAAEYCLAMGFFHALLDLGTRGLAVTDPARRLDRYWLLSGKTGTALAVLGQLEQAEEFYVEPLSLSSKPMLHMNNSYSLAMLALRRGLPERVAVIHLNNAIAIAGGLPDPVDAVYYTVISQVGLALIDMEAGRLTKALHAISGGLDRLNAELPAGKYEAHRSVFAYNKATVLIRLDRLDEAIEQLGVAIGLDPDYPQYYIDRAAVLAQVGRHAEAIADFAAAQERTPPFWELHYNRAAVRAEAGDREGSIEDFGRVIELEPPDEELIEALAGRASLQFEARDHAAAIADLNRALELAGEDPDLLFNRAVVYQETGDWQAAISDYTRAIDLPGADVEELEHQRSECLARLASDQVPA